MWKRSIELDYQFVDLFVTLFSVLLYDYNLHVRLTVADPEFPRLGTPTSKVGAPTYYLAKFFPKTS